jgi:sugar phosphate isomerase/epimerase
MGFDAIEFTDDVFGDCDKEIAKKFRAEADRVGIEISNVAIWANLLSDTSVETLKNWVDIAEILGAPFIRHDVARSTGLKHYIGYDNVLQQLANACREVTEYAASKGVRTTTENHGFFSQESFRIEKLINAVAHDNFGQLIDLGNFLCADEDPATAVGRCARYAFYVHAKDFIVKDGNGLNPGKGFFMSRGGNYLRGTIVGHGTVPVSTCLSILAAAGYDVFVGVEFEGIEPMRDALTIGLENLRNYHP